MVVQEGPDSLAAVLPGEVDGEVFFGGVIGQGAPRRSLAVSGGVDRVPAAAVVNHVAPVPCTACQRVHAVRHGELAPALVVEPVELHQIPGGKIRLQPQPDRLRVQLRRLAVPPVSALHLEERPRCGIRTALILGIHPLGGLLPVVPQAHGQIVGSAQSVLADAVQGEVGGQGYHILQL